VLTAGEIDLSIGSIVAISALLAATVLRQNFWFLGAAVGLGAGVGIGAFNGLLVAYLRLPSFLVTLATMGFLAGAARWLTDMQSVPIANDNFNNIFGAGKLLGIPSLVIWAIVIVCLGHCVYREKRYGAISMQSATAPSAPVPSVSKSIAYAFLSWRFPASRPVSQDSFTLVASTEPATRSVRLTY